MDFTENTQPEKREREIYVSLLLRITYVCAALVDRRLDEYAAILAFDEKTEEVVFQAYHMVRIEDEMTRKRRKERKEEMNSKKKGKRKRKRNLIPLSLYR